jgi:hypothetical protein
MSEGTPTRTISGLAPRANKPATDLSRLLASNRSVASPATSVDEVGQNTPAPTTESTDTPAAPASKIVRPEPTEPAPEIPSVGKVKDTVSLNSDVIYRAKRAFLATRSFEDEASWSEFVETAIIALVEKREAEYNKGKKFDSSKTKLTAGRPMRL